MTFSPPRSVISGITNANPAVVTTTSAHGLSTGMIARLNIPLPYGIQELNKIAAVITKLSSTTFSLQYTQQPVASNINSTNYSAFITPSQQGTQPEVVPIGSSPVLNSTSNYFETQLYDEVVNYSTVAIPF